MGSGGIHETIKDLGCTGPECESKDALRQFVCSDCVRARQGHSGKTPVRQADREIRIHWNGLLLLMTDPGLVIARGENPFAGEHSPMYPPFRESKLFRFARTMIIWTTSKVLAH